MGRWDEQERTALRSLELRRALAAAFPNVVDYRWDMAESLTAVGVAARNRRHWDEAIRYFREAVAQREVRLRIAPTRYFCYFDLAFCLHKLGNTLRSRARSEPSDGGLILAALAAGPLAAAPLGAGRAMAARLDLEESRRVLERAVSHEASALRLGAPAGGPVPKYLRLHYVSLVETLLELNDQAAAARAAEELSRIFPDGWEQYHAAAGLLARCAAAAKWDNRLREVYILRSLELLRQAVSRGWRDADKLAKDPDFAALQGRPDFTRLVAEVRAKQ
jgi:tetratricopeptide (TPR) repeat protein